MNIFSFLKDDSGNESSMRLLVALVILTIVGTWSYVSITTKTMAPLNWSETGALIGALLAKAWQKQTEAKIATPGPAEIRP